MTPKRPYTLKIDEDLLAAIRDIRIREGIPESEQIRRGIRLWLESRGEKAGRKRRKEKRA
jgi:Arc/MetJ-type ribon-helix-helix transcriptional regulator